MQRLYLFQSKPHEDPGLHGLRALSLLSILLLHFWIALLHLSAAPAIPEWLQRIVLRLSSGLDLFFVLSGFLIGQLLNETPVEPRSILQFYLRRLMRIAPAYYVFLPLNLLAALHLASGLPAELATQMRADFLHGFRADLFYVGNYAGRSTGIHLWSLAVEAHFYLAAPVLILFFRRERDRALALVFVYLSCLFLRIWQGDAANAYGFTHLRLDSIAIGWLLAILDRRLADRAPGAVALWILLSIAGLLLAAAHLAPDQDSGLHVWRFNAQNIAFAILGFCTLRSDSLKRALGACVFVFLARISYGAYLWHILAGGYVVSQLMRHFPQLSGGWMGFLALLAGFLAASVGAGLFSLILIESPVLRLAPRRTSQ